MTDIAKLHQKLSEALENLPVHPDAKVAIDRVFAEAQTGKTEAERAAAGKVVADKAAATAATAASKTHPGRPR